MGVGPDEMVDLEFLQDRTDERSAPRRAELISSSEANVRKTVTSEK